MLSTFHFDCLIDHLIPHSFIHSFSIREYQLRHYLGTGGIVMNTQTKILKPDEFTSVRKKKMNPKVNRYYTTIHI